MQRWLPAEAMALANIIVAEGNLYKSPEQVWQEAGYVVGELKRKHTPKGLVWETCDDGRITSGSPITTFTVSQQHDGNFSLSWEYGTLHDSGVGLLTFPSQEEAKVYAQQVQDAKVRELMGSLLPAEM